MWDALIGSIWLLLPRCYFLFNFCSMDFGGISFCERELSSGRLMLAFDSSTFSSRLSSFNCCFYSLREFWWLKKFSRLFWIFVMFSMLALLASAPGPTIGPEPSLTWSSTLRNFYRWLRFAVFFLGVWLLVKSLLSLMKSPFPRSDSSSLSEMSKLQF